jgi:hypothetical protein
MRESLAAAALTFLFAACSSPKGEPAKIDTATPHVPAQLGGAPGSPACQPNGLWAQCSVLYRLERGGFGVKIDSAEKADEKTLAGATKTFVLKIGANARLDVFLFPDSTARIAAASKLDRKQFVNATAPQTMKRERTLIENANLVGLLTSLNSKMRERVSNALEAGAPQPPSKK